MRPLPSQPTSQGFMFGDRAMPKHSRRSRTPDHRRSAGTNLVPVAQERSPSAAAVRTSRPVASFMGNDPIAVIRGRCSASHLRTLFHADRCWLRPTWAVPKTMIEWERLRRPETLLRWRLWEAQTWPRTAIKGVCGPADSLQFTNVPRLSPRLAGLAPPARLAGSIFRGQLRQESAL